MRSNVRKMSWTQPVLYPTCPIPNLSYIQQSDQFFQHIYYEGFYYRFCRSLTDFPVDFQKPPFH